MIAFLGPHTNRRQPPLASLRFKLVCIRTPGDCGSSTAPNMEKFPERLGARGLPGAGAPSRVQGASMPPPDPPRAQTFFEFFLRAGAIQPLGVLLTRCNRADFFNNPPCDDFLTMVVDNPDGWGL